MARDTVKHGGSSSMYFGYGQPQQVIPGGGSLSDVFHRHLLPHLSLEDLKNLSGVNHDWREAVWSSPPEIWRKAAHRHLRSQHPLLSLPPSRLQQGLYDYGRSHARLCSGQPQHTELHQHAAEHIFLAPDGSWMVLLSSSTLHCYALPSNELQHTVQVHAPMPVPRAHAFRRDGSILALIWAGSAHPVFLLHRGTWRSSTVNVPMIQPQLEWHPVQPWLTSTFHINLLGRRHPAVKMELGEQQAQAVLLAEQRPVRLLWNAAGTRLAVFLRRNNGLGHHAGGPQAAAFHQAMQHQPAQLPALPPAQPAAGVQGNAPQLQHMLPHMDYYLPPLVPGHGPHAAGDHAGGRGRGAIAANQAPGNNHTPAGMPHVPPPHAPPAGRGRGQGMGAVNVVDQQVVLEEPDVEANSATKVAIIGDVHAMDLLTMLRRLPDSTYIQSAAWMQDDIHLALVLMRSSPGSAELQLYNSHTGVAVRHLSAADAWLTSAAPEDTCQVHLTSLPGDEQLVGWGRRGVALVDTWGGWLTCQLSRTLGAHCCQAVAVSPDGRHVAVGWHRDWECCPPEAEAAAVILSAISGQVEWELHKQTLGSLALSARALHITPAWHGNDLVILVESDLHQRNKRLHHVICARFSDA